MPLPGVSMAGKFSGPQSLVQTKVDAPAKLIEILQPVALLLGPDRAFRDVPPLGYLRGRLSPETGAALLFDYSNVPTETFWKSCGVFRCRSRKAPGEWFLMP